MIESIRKAWLNAADRPISALADGAMPRLTRGDFLRASAAGALAIGFGGTACATSAGQARKVAPVTDIEKLYDTWQERLNAGDLEGLVDLYMDDVTYINPDGQLLFGKDKVRADFEGLLSIKPQIVLGNRKHLLYKDIALTTNHWRMNFVNADGVKQELTGGGIEVMRKDPRDGGWRYIIDDASRSASK